MLINAPVYSLQNNTHFVNIYTENEDGTFKRTQSEPLRLLRDDFDGISMSQGELTSSHFDRQERSWSTATVSYHYGRPQSFYQFLRDMVARNKFFVFSKPVLSGHLIKFDVHELKLKNSMSQRKISILKEKYIEALELWTKEEYELRQQQQLEQQLFEQQQKRLLSSTSTQKAKLIQGLPPRSGAVAGFTETGRVVAFKSKNGDKNKAHTQTRLQSESVSGEVESGSPGGVQSRQTDALEAVHQSTQDQNTVPTRDDDNPFNDKSIFRHNHFLRRFIFNRS